MATYTRKYCPHCGKQYQNYSTYTKNMTVKNGCPIITCQYCGTPFLDKDVKEPAFDDMPKETNLWQIFLAPMFPFGAACVLLWIATICTLEIGYFMLSLFPLAFYVFIVIAIYKKRDVIDADSIKEYKESAERVSDKEYIIQLLELGYQVPTSFLASRFPDLLNYKRRR